MINRQLLEATLSQLKNKQRSITRRFPDFYSNPIKVKGIIAHGGVRLAGMEKDIWRFDVASGEEAGKSYEITMRWKNVVPELQRAIQDRRNWNKQKTKVNLNKVATYLYKKLDVEIKCSCFTGDTEVLLLDGRILTFEEILREFGTEKEFWVYASDENGDFVPARARCLGETKRVNQVTEVTLDNNKTIKCTLDHLFRMRDGSYKEAQQLKEGDSLMPCYTKQTEPNSKFSQSYTQIKSNSKKDSIGRSNWKTIYRIVAELLLKEQHNKKLSEFKDKDLVVHHKDFNSNNNCPENLEWLSVLEHWELHTKNHPEAKKAQAKRICRIRKETTKRDPVTGGFYNHKVKSIKILEVSNEPVYDLTVEKYQNFALAAGIYVHNCPADLYYGGQYIRSKDKYKANYGDKEDRPPVQRNPKEYGSYCKHLTVFMKVMPFYKSDIAKWLKDNYSEVITKEEKNTSAKYQSYKKVSKKLGNRKQGK